MEILLTLSNINNLEKVLNAKPNGLIFGSKFSTRFKYSIEELDRINDFCLHYNLKRYVSIDAFINESDKYELVLYLNHLKELHLDGIYFNDLGIIALSRRHEINCELIYNSDTLMTNSLDAAFYLKQDIGVVVSNILSVEELFGIIRNNLNSLDLQVFGYLKMANSKREFLTNYFKHLGILKDIKNKKDIYLVEENRNYKLPIIEDEYGTRIYGDSCLLMYNELAYVKDYLKRIIVDDLFLENSDIAYDVIKDIKHLTVENSEYLKEVLMNKYPDIDLSTAYLYQKSTKTKEENE